MPLPPRPKPTQLKTQINTRNLQEMLESASNAAQKGQAQYLTPVAWSRALTRGLPNYRPCITDLTCGHGTLLSGAAGDSTTYLLGCDIDATHDALLERATAIQARRVTGDITKFFPLLQKVNWQFDLGTFNAPWDLHQHRDRVPELADSYCPAVREAFAAHDGRTAQGTIDSTVLLLCMALDRLTTRGEAFIIANQATLDRLILAEDAPHQALRTHCWAHLVIAGNICAPQRAAVASVADTILPADQTKPPGQKATDFQTGILYFARDHYGGFEAADTLRFPLTATPEEVGERLASPGFRIARRGARIKPGLANLDSPKLWEAAREEWSLLQESNQRIGGWNILLGPDGNLITNLSTYDTASGRANKKAADRLFQLNGKHPMHLVMAMESRRELQRAIDGVDAPWRVAPAVIAAVNRAVNEYNCARAPLVPLNEIQRLGYIDENETILCLKDLGPFIAGQRYALKTETLRTSRSGTKMNLEGSLDNVEYEGSELAIYVTPGQDEKPLLFMEARLMADTVRLSIQDEGEPSPINYTLNQLVDHFEIPEVPDVATLNPEAYQRNLALLAEIEQLVA